MLVVKRKMFTLNYHLENTKDDSQMQFLDTPAKGMLQEMSGGNTTPRVSTALALDDLRTFKLGEVESRAWWALGR